MVTRFQGSGRIREGGRSAVYLQDFHAHYTGGDFRHGASQIDMDPPIADPFNGTLSFTTVQDTLQHMAELINERGFGWITIGDGYDIGDYNVGTPGIATITDAFNAAFTNPRLVNGGVILVKAGTYRLSETVTVPPGITIMGEPAGTHIIGNTNNQPMFYVTQSKDRFLQGTISSVSYYTANTVDVNKFYNLILSDNIDGYVVDGFNQPVATMTTVPMIQGVYGSNIFCERTTFLGRLSNTNPPLAMTKWAIAYDNTVPAPGKPTTLQCSDCYFDGMGVAVQFDPIEGALDYLRIERCRAKTGAFSVASAGSAFVVFNLCNVDILNNFHVGDVSLGAKGFAVLTSTTPTDSNVRVNITGNHGGLTTTNGNALNNLFVNNNSDTFAGTVFGNSWGANYNQWYVSVGDGVNSMGDINGTNAIDIALERSTFGVTLSDKRDTHVFVGYGTYTVTVGGLTNYVNLIGLDRNGQLPVLELNSLNGDDPAANPTTSFGPYIKKIKFKTSALTAEYNTILINYADINSSGDSVIEDCQFENAGIAYPEIARATSNKISIELKRCHFNQTGTYPNNYNFLITGAANTISLVECTARGKGYLGGIGTNTSIGYEPTIPPQQTIVIDKCVFDQCDTYNTSASFAITIESVLEINSYLYVNSERARLIITNTDIICADDTAATATDIILPALLTAGDFTRYIELQAREIYIDNTLIIGPDQRFIRTGTTWNLPAVVAEPIRLINVTNSKMVGACALQVTGILQFQYIEESGSVNLIGNEFSGHVDGYGTCVLDLDIKKFTIGASEALPSLTIDNCLVNNKFNPSNTNVDVVRTHNTTTCLAAASINAEGWNVKISNSVFNGNLATNLPSTYTTLAGLCIDTSKTTSGTFSDSCVMMNNSVVKLINDLDTVTASNRSTSLQITSPHILISNNSFNYTTSLSAASISTRAFMVIQTSDSLTDKGSVVIGNSFGRTGALSIGGIIILSNSGRGTFVDNDFDQPTLDGSSTTLFVDNVTLPWIKERNRNQTSTLAITAWTGVQKINGESLGLDGYLNYGFRPNEANGNQIYRVEAGAGAVQSIWGTDLTTVLPANVHIISATASLSFSGGTPTGNHFLELTSTSNNDLSGAVTAPGGGTLTVTATSPTTNYLVNSTLRPFIWVFYLTSNSGGVAFTDAIVTPIIVTFRW